MDILTKTAVLELKKSCLCCKITDIYLLQLSTDPPPKKNRNYKILNLQTEGRTILNLKLLYIKQVTGHVTHRFLAAFTKCNSIKTSSVYLVTFLTFKHRQVSTDYTFSRSCNQTDSFHNMCPYKYNKLG